MSSISSRRNPYRNVSPIVLLRAIECANGAEDEANKSSSGSGGPIQEARTTTSSNFQAIVHDSNLTQSINDASQEEQAFGLKVGRSAQLLRAWCHEVEGWDASALAGHDEGPSNAGSAEKESIPPWLYTPPEAVEQHRERIRQLRCEVSSLDVDSQKTIVLSTHHGYKTLNGDRVASGQSQEGKLTDLAAFTTAIVLESLPYYGRILNLLETWTARLNTIQHAHGFEAGLAKLKDNLAQAWTLFEPEVDGQRQEGHMSSVKVERAEYDILREELSQRSTVAGKQLDSMLDALEGRPDTLPISWIEDVDALEADVARWTTAAEAQVRADEEQTRVNEDNDVQQLRHALNGGRIAPPLVLEDHDAAKVSRQTPHRPGTSVRPNVPEILIDGMVAGAFTSAGTSSEHSGDSATTNTPKKHPTSLNPDPNETLVIEKSRNHTSQEAANKNAVTHVQYDHLHRSTSDTQLLQHRETVSAPRYARMSTLEKTLFLSGRGVKQLHRRNSSAELFIGDASVASGFSMAEVKRVNISRTRSDTAQMHQRKISDKLTRSSLQNLAEEGVSTSSFMVKPDPSLEVRDAAPAEVDTKDFADHETSCEPLPASTNEAAAFLEDLPGSEEANSVGSLHQSQTLVPPAEVDFARPIEPASVPAPKHSSSDVDLPLMPQRKSAQERQFETPVKARPKTPLTSTDDRIEHRIDHILHTLPTRINFNKRATKRSPSRLSSSSRIADKSPSPQNNPFPAEGARPQTPALTLTHVEQSSLSSSKLGTRSTTLASGIRLYHLHAVGGSQPIKLFVRLVGDDGRVMVRVGGGWEDLEKYLKDYSAHHSSTIVANSAVPPPNPKLTIGDATGMNGRRAFTAPNIVADRSRSDQTLRQIQSSQHEQASSRLARAPVASPSPAYGQTLQIPKQSTPGNKTIKRTSSMQKILDTTSTGLPKPVPPSAPVSSEDHTYDDDASDGSQSPGYSPSHITAERRQWLSEMVKKAKKWKAEGGSGISQSHSSEVAEGSGSHGNPLGHRRVYRSGDGVLKLL